MSDAEDDEVVHLRVGSRFSTTDALNAAVAQYALQKGVSGLCAGV